MYLLELYPLGEHDVQTILKELKCVHNVDDLGTNLYLYPSKIRRIMGQDISQEEKKREIILSWIRREATLPCERDLPPTWNELANSVASEGVHISEVIRMKHCRNLTQKKTGKQHCCISLFINAEG